MKFKLFLTSCAAVATGLASGANAATQFIDFSALAPGTFSAAVFGDYRIEHALQYGQDPVLFVSDTGTNAIGDDQTGENIGTGLILSRVDGAVFAVDAMVFSLLGEAGKDTRVAIDPYGDINELVFVNTDDQAYAGPRLTGLKALFLDFYADSGALGISSITVDNDVAGAVPEPATWALMMGGFGLTGTALRRRRLAPMAATAA